MTKKNKTKPLTRAEWDKVWGIMCLYTDWCKLFEVEVERLVAKALRARK